MVSASPAAPPLTISTCTRANARRTCTICDAAADHDALAAERVEHDSGAFGIVAGERRRRFEHRDFGAEAAERLRQFEAGRAGADDDQMARALGEIEYRLVGEIGRAGQARDRRQAGDEPVAMTKRRALMSKPFDRDGRRIGKAPLALR